MTHLAIIYRLWLVPFVGVGDSCCIAFCATATLSIKGAVGPNNLPPYM